MALRAGNIPKNRTLWYLDIMSFRFFLYCRSSICFLQCANSNCRFRWTSEGMSTPLANRRSMSRARFLTSFSVCVWPFAVPLLLFPSLLDLWWLWEGFLFLYAPSRDDPDTSTSAYDRLDPILFVWSGCEVEYSGGSYKAIAVGAKCEQFGACWAEQCVLQVSF